MQLIWLSGPTARVVTLSITRRTIWLGLGTLIAVLLVLGASIQFFGLRVAIELRPELARTLGAVTTTSEQERIEQHYQEQLTTLEQQIDGLTQKLATLEKTKQQIVELIPARPARAGAGGQGGPVRFLEEFDWFAPSATEKLNQLSLVSSQLDQQVSLLSETWTLESLWLKHLPIQAPVLAEHHVSSGFGLRRDPFTRALSRHEGIDYVAPTGTPVVSTAPGRVIQAGYRGAYGFMVDVEHEWGFTTRYAHLRRILVRVGDVVQVGQPVGLLGNTGRSTGPHLHYEVRFRDRPIPPEADHVIRVARQQRVFPDHLEARF
jgi:murein DD-endopeptidase MepM/ murein hydrolase activator NlpD